MRSVVFFMVTVGALLGLESIAFAYGTFDCGSGWALYTTTGVNGTGVRCMKYVPATATETDGYAWYGEGVRNGSTYRHIGVVRRAFGYANRYVGSAADIHGNGEQLNNVYDGTMRLDRASAIAYPTAFTVAPWSETWTNAGLSGTTIYTSPFTQPAIECGSNFYDHTLFSTRRQYKVFLYADSTLKSEVGPRCVLGLDPFSGDVWYGAGENRTRPSEGTNPTPTPWSAPLRYAHLGVRSGTSYGQWDICQNTDYCASRGFGTINATIVTLPQTGDGIRLDGSTLASELWIPSRKPHSLRVRGLIARSSAAGLREPHVTEADMDALVTRANDVYQGTDIEFLYNTPLPAGAGGALVKITDATLNEFDQQGSGPEWSRATFFAERTPSDVVAIFTWGNPSAPCPKAGGVSGGGWSFVSTVALHPGGGCVDHQLCGVLDDGQFAHEVGHYLGLVHTFPMDPSSGQPFAAQVNVENAYKTTCDPSMFDYDMISDTLRDPFSNDHLCNAALTSVTLSVTCGVKTFSLPRTNIMSYYLSSGFPFDKTLTTGQRNAMNSNLVSVGARNRLE
jgi:hypothetical protein